MGQWVTVWLFLKKSTFLRTFFLFFWCLGRPGGSPGTPRESPRAPWAPPGCLGGVPGHPGSDFGSPRGCPRLRLGIHFEVILASFFLCFFVCFFNAFLGRFGFHFGTILEQFWDRKSIQNLIKFWEGFWEWCWVSAGTLQGEKPWFSLESCSKSRVDLFASGCLRERFRIPKWSQNGRQNPQKIIINTPRKSFRNSSPKVSQN